MEDISFSSFFRFISSQTIRIPLIETAIIQNESVETILTVNSEGYLKKKDLTKSIPVQAYLQKLLLKHESRNKFLQEKSSKVCYFYKKGSRSLIHDLRIKEILSKSRPVINVDLIQIYKRNLSDKDKFLHLKLSYIQSQYVAEIFYGESKVTDPLITENALDIATIIIHCIEQNTLKRVIQIEVEYIQDVPGSLWVANVPKCAIVEARYTFKYPILKEEDILTLSKTVPKNLGLSKTPKILKETQKHVLPFVNSLYTFRRGQLRNVHSNLDSPIRMTPVGQVLTEDPIAEEPSKLKMALSADNLNYRADTPLEIKEKEPNDQLLIRELLKGFFTVGSKEHTSFLFENKNSLKFTDGQKRLTGLRKTNQHSTVKSFQKLLKRKEYDNDFIECVIRTYFKGRDLPGGRKEFGIASHITSEEYTQFLNSVDGNKEEISRNRLGQPIVEESFYSRPSTPGVANRKKIEFQFVKNILASRKMMKKTTEQPKKPKKSKSTKRIIDLCISSPRSLMVKTKGNKY